MIATTEMLPGPLPDLVECRAISAPDRAQHGVRLPFGRRHAAFVVAYDATVLDVVETIEVPQTVKIVKARNIGPRL